MNHWKKPALAALCAAFLLLPLATLAAGEEQKNSEGAEVTTAKVAQISISGSLPDALAADNPFGPATTNFRKLLETIRSASRDSDIAAVLLEVDSPGIGFGKIKELRAALAELKEAGKKIVAYSESCGLKDMTILSMCDFLALPESGTVVMPGFTIEVWYYKDLFEKLGVRMLVEHIGDYKSAFENYHREGMSDENREVLNVLLDEFYTGAVAMIAEGRGISQEAVAMAIDRAILTVKEAHGLGLIDAVMYRDQFDSHLKEILGAGELKIVKKYGQDSTELDTSNPFAFMTQIMAALRGKQKEESDAPKIAVIYASGPIMSGSGAGSPFSTSPVVGSDTLVKAINEAAKDDTVKAIVLRVDSPGGSGLASDVIWRAECEAKKKKPFIVSMADVAGSGGYYIAMAGDVILAEPGTITGSIGVVSALPNIHGTFEKLGIKVERLTRGQNANIDSLTVPPEHANLSIIARFMEKFYWDFVDKVAAGRKMTREQIHEIAQGRVWTGRQAVENGLVDGIGGLTDAIEVARIKAGLSDEDEWEVVESPEPPDFFALLSGGGLEVRAALCRALGLGSGMELALLEAVPELKQALDRFFAFFRMAREETCLYVMPAEIIVR